MICIYTYKRSELNGKKCDVKVCKYSEKYCSKHVYIEKKEKLPKKEKENKPFTVINSKETEIIEDDIVENEKGYLLIKDTSYIVNSIKNKVVIGKLVSKKFCSLTNEDVEECIKNNWLFEQFI